MRRVAVLLLLSALLTGAGVLAASPAAACSCASATTAQYFADADAVFTGRLVSREVDRPQALHVFAVDAVYKGSVRAEQGVVSADSGASCGLELQGGGPFVVFAQRSPDAGEHRLEANLCGGTAPVNAEVEAELETLAGSGSDAAPGRDPGPDALLPPAGEIAVAVAAVAVPLLLAATGWLLWRRRSRGRRPTGEVVHPVAPGRPG